MRALLVCLMMTGVVQAAEADYPLVNLGEYATGDRETRIVTGKAHWQFQFTHDESKRVLFWVYARNSSSYKLRFEDPNSVYQAAITPVGNITGPQGVKIPLCWYPANAYVYAYWPPNTRVVAPCVGWTLTMYAGWTYTANLYGVASGTLGKGKMEIYVWPQSSDGEYY